MNAPESTRWLAYGRTDLDAAQSLLRDPDHYPRQVCFLAQQAAEKALKAVLVLLEIEFPFTHDLDRLREMVPTAALIAVLLSPAAATFDRGSRRAQHRLGRQRRRKQSELSKFVVLPPATRWFPLLPKHGRRVAAGRQCLARTRPRS